MTTLRRRPTRRITSLIAAMAASATGALFGASPAGATPVSGSAGYRLSADFALAVGPARSFELNRTETGCNFGNPAVQHVFYIGFDNFHLRRDNANTVAANGDDNHNSDLNIPSDLEQVPALYNFLRGASNAPSGSTNTGYTDGTPYPGGTVLANHHSPIISHTSVDFTAAYSGVYGDQNGIATAQNNVAAYNGSAYTGGTSSGAQSVSTAGGGGFGYWTDPLGVTGDSSLKFITAGSTPGTSQAAPAPWVPFTRAGCDVGAVAATTMVLENNTSIADANAQPSNNSTPYAAKDEGIAVHCAATGNSICDLASTDPNVKIVADNLPGEPGSPYTGTATSGYRAILGTEYVAPAVNDGLNGSVPTGGGSTTLALLRSGTTTATQDATSANPAGDPTSFPGFNSEDGNYTLGYTLAMQKAGIPVTFGYLTTAHNCYNSLSGDYSFPPTSPLATTSRTNAVCNHTDVPGDTVQNASGGGGAFGSGEQGYVNYLKNLNSDFQAFFDQAKAAGFTTANTEFVFYSDESDNISEGTPANPTCDGVTTPCQWNHEGSSGVSTGPTTGQMGEVTVKLDTANPALVQGGNPSYQILADSAPEFYVEEQGASGPPAQADPAVRGLERQVASTTYTDPYTGTTGTKLARFEADQAGMNALHMVTADPNRTPTFVAFAPGPDYVEAGFPSDCSSTTVAACSNAGFIGVHGDFAPETFTTWAGFAGPGVANLGTTNVFTDHTDLRPTLLALVGLTDDYQSAGRVITEILQPGVVPATGTTATAQMLGVDLKKVSAPTFGATETSDTAGFAPAILVADTSAVQGGSSGDDHVWSTTDACINTLVNERNMLVSQIQGTLASADTGTAINPSVAANEDNQAANLVTEADQLGSYANGSTTALPADCSLGNQLPEASHAALLVVSGGVTLAVAIFLIGLRRRRASA